MEGLMRGKEGRDSSRATLVTTDRGRFIKKPIQNDVLVRKFLLCNPRGRE
jgi:hypothetical protein